MNNLSVVCHLSHKNGHVYELLTSTRWGKWFRMSAGTMEHIENYCNFLHPEFTPSDSVVYNTLEEFMPCETDISRYKKELRQMMRYRDD